MLLPWPSEGDLVPAARKLAVRLLEYACDGSRGRGQRDPIYVSVTEGRDVGAMRDKYSSCGDLPHWMYSQLGVRLPWVNRGCNGGWTYLNGRDNISCLYHPSYNPLAEKYRAGMAFEPGDVGVIWNANEGNKTHAFCVVDQLEDGVMLTAEYGQPGGKLLTRAIRGGRLASQQPGGIFKTGRSIQYRLRLSAVIEAAREAGLLEPAQDPTRAEDGEPTWRP